MNHTTAAQSMHWRPYTSTKQQPYYLDVFSGETLSSVVSHYVFKIIDNDPAEGLPDCLPISVGETSMPQAMWATLASPKSAWITEEDVVFFWVEGDEVKVVVSSVSPGIPVQSVSGIVYRHEENAEYEACPFSGRVCVLGAEGDSEIHIMNYLVPQQ